jgi:hypothetical protein
MGHVYYQAEQWVDARDAYQDALELYNNNINSGSNASCHKQELVDLRRDIQELDRRIVLQRNNNNFHEVRYLSRQQQKQSNEEALYF